MLDWLFMMLMVFAILLMFFSIEYFKDKDYFWSFAFALLSTVLWFLLASSVLEIEQSYQMFNSTSGEVEEGIHIITSKIAPEMVYLFMIPGIIMFIFTVLQVFTAVYDSIFKKGRR